MGEDPAPSSAWSAVCPGLCGDGHYNAAWWHPSLAWQGEGLGAFYINVSRQPSASKS
jgi:hypothetical protein